ncbi:response regulator [Curtobacterium ammoniigenes]|uniref:response regulator n=1 Tax=Curtobacterium ammoniigenes TaxID=395387 RepID=UPI000AF1D6D5|nr:response regulator [Curtobacterium ammoniigenes]
MSAELTVMVVDDDFRVAAVHEGFVGRVDGCRFVGTAHTAADAVARARALRPDLILLDVYLPDGDGFGVIRELREEPWAPMFFVISAAGDADAVQQAVRLGAAQYLVKPFGFDAFAERLAAIRDLRVKMSAWPEEPTQGDIDGLFGMLRSSPNPVAELGRLSPTLEAIYSAMVDSASPLSAVEVAQRVGISRATAQRYLTQLERSNLVRLELRYGATGRPEHQYLLRR